MSEILIDKFIAEEAKLEDFIAPVVSPGYARVHISGLLKIYKVLPPTYEGFAVLKPHKRVAKVVRNALYNERMEYLKRLSSLRMILIQKIKNRSWLSLPYNIADATQRFSINEPKLVHLVEDCLPLDQVIAAVDGNVLWFSEVDEKGDYEIAERLRNATPKNLDTRKLTPEQIQAFKIAHKIYEATRKRTLEERLQDALSVSGATLRDYKEGRIEDTLDVSWEWEGRTHRVTINKDSFRILSAGFCISGHDADYTLHSIVSVWKERDYDW